MARQPLQPPYGCRKPRNSRVPIATFPNVNGLIGRSGNVYIGSESSGSPVLRFAKSGSARTIASGALENSTFDLGTEFTNLIIAQRAYSATSRVITTADEMLDDLVRIKTQIQTVRIQYLRARSLDPDRSGLAIEN